MSSKPSPRQNSQQLRECEEAQVLSLDELRTAIASIAAVASALLAHIGQATTRITPVMLTSEEFAERHKDVSPETIERRCRKGEYPLAQNPGGSGWRIPEFYLWRRDPPPELRGCFARSDEREAPAEQGATPSTGPAGEQDITHSPDAGAADDTAERGDDAIEDEIDAYLELLTDPDNEAVASPPAKSPRGGNRKSGCGPPQLKGRKKAA